MWGDWRGDGGGDRGGVGGVKALRDRTAFGSHYGCMTHSSVPEVLDDDALRRRVAALERAVASTRRADRWRMVLPAALAAAVLPALAWSASVPHPGFQAGDVISASEINANVIREILGGLSLWSMIHDGFENQRDVGQRNSILGQLNKNLMQHSHTDSLRFNLFNDGGGKLFGSIEHLLQCFTREQFMREAFQYFTQMCNQNTQRIHNGASLNLR